MEPNKETKDSEQNQETKDSQEENVVFLLNKNMPPFLSCKHFCNFLLKKKFSQKANAEFEQEFMIDPYKVVNKSI